MKKTIIEEDNSNADRVQAKTDHDTLIRVETKLDQVMLGALPSLSNDIKDLREGLLPRIVILETWKQKEDSYHAGIPLATYDDNSKWVSNFRSNLKFITVMITILATLLSGLLVTILQHLFHF